MGPQGILTMAGALGGGAMAGAGFHMAGASLAVAASAALMGGVSILACIAAFRSERGRRTAEARFDTLAEEMVLLRQRQADLDGKLGAVEQRTVESPALVWRAATADIQVLGSLVSDLAKAVADHETRLNGAGEITSGVVSASPVTSGLAPRAGRSFVLPETSPPPPSWFEDEAELGFTADPTPAAVAVQKLAEPPVPARVSARPEVREHLSPAVLADLKSTLAAALMSDRLELCLQPFVTLPQRKVAGYEASLRLKAEGSELQGADELRTAAEMAGMARDLDRTLIERTGQVLRVLRARERIVAITCPVTGDSLADSAFRSAVETVARGEGKLAQNLMLSIPLADAAGLAGGDGEALKALGRMGVALGVRASSSARIDAAALEKMGVTEARMPATLLLGGQGGSDIHPADMGELLDRRNIRLVVTGVDSEQSVRDLLDISTALAQGELFGASRPVRPEVLQPRPVGQPASSPNVRQRASRGAAQETEPRRQSFRSLLRRA